MAENHKDLAMNNHKREGTSETAYLLALFPIIILFIYRVVPFFSALILPFKEYEILQGTGGSSWVGMDNFKELFNSFFFSKILRNTIILKLEYVVLCSVIALLVTLILGFIRSKFWQRLFSAIFLVPYFIPTVVFSYLILYSMGSAGMFFLFSTESLMEPESFRLVYSILEVIKNLGIPVIIALGAINAKRETDDGTGGFVNLQLLPALKAIGLFALIQLSSLLTMDYELLSQFQNPMVYEVADTIDTHSFRMGLMNGKFGVASAAWLIRYIIQLILTLVIFLLIKGQFTKDIFPKGAKKDKKMKRPGSLVAVIAGLFIVEIYLLLTTAPLAVSVMEVSKTGGEISKNLIEAMPHYSSAVSDTFYRSYVTYLLVIGVAVVINAIFTILLAYPLTVKGLPGKKAYSIFLIAVLNMEAGGIHEYIFFRNRGMHNTVFPYLITGFFTLINVFVLKAIYNARYTSIEDRTINGVEGDIQSFFKRYLPRVIKPILGLAALQYAFMWNSFYPGQLVYVADVNKFSPVMMFRNTMAAQPEIFGSLTPEVMRLAAIISIPGLIVLLLLMIFGSDEIFIGQVRKS